MRISRYCLILLLLATRARAADFTWQPVRVEGRDYVTLQQVVEFYGFTTPLAPVDNVISLESDKAELKITLNSREVQINGVKRWLGFQVLAVDGKVLLSRLDLSKII